MLRPRTDAIPGRSGGLGLLVVLLLVAPASVVAQDDLSLLGAVSGFSGEEYPVRTPDWLIECDSRWFDSRGYRRVRVTVTPRKPLPGRRRLSIEYLTRHRDRETLRTVATLELPAGNQPQSVELLVPQLGVVSRQENELIVRDESGGEISRTREQPAARESRRRHEHSLEEQLVRSEELPVVLIVGDQADTRMMLWALAHFRAGGPVIESIVRAAQHGGIINTVDEIGPVDFVPALPGTSSVALGQLPDDWLGYAAIDMVVLPLADAVELAADHPTRWEALMQWTAAGGNLLLFGLGGLEPQVLHTLDWDRLVQVDSLLGQPDAQADGTAWLQPDPLPILHEATMAAIRLDDEGETLRQRAVMLDSIEAYQSATGRRLTDEQFEHLTAIETSRRLQYRPPQATLHFRWRNFLLGRVVVVAEPQVFPGSALDWFWMYETALSDRLLWRERVAVSNQRENAQFYDMLVRGAGLAPVTAFRVLITLFVLTVGPLVFLWLWRVQKLHLMILLVPAVSLLMTLALAAYALLADGLGTRIRVRTITVLDQDLGREARWSRLSYYAGLAPADGLTFSDQTVVLPLVPNPNTPAPSPEKLVVRRDGQQRLASGWLGARRPTQFVLWESQPTRRRLEVRTEASTGPLPNYLVRNRLGGEIEQLLLRAEDGRLFWHESLDPGKTVKLAEAETQRLLEVWWMAFEENEPRLPEGLQGGPSTRLFTRSYSSLNYSRRSQSLVVNLSGNLMETELNSAKLATLGDRYLPPGRYLAVVRDPDYQTTGIAEFPPEEAFHVISGNW